eukprot:5478781-Amphidinium_carterae.1
MQRLTAPETVGKGWGQPRFELHNLHLAPEVHKRFQPLWCNGALEVPCFKKLPTMQVGRLGSAWHNAQHSTLFQSQACGQDGLKSSTSAAHNKQQPCWHRHLVRNLCGVVVLAAKRRWEHLATCRARRHVQTESPRHKGLDPQRLLQAMKASEVKSTWTQKVPLAKSGALALLQERRRQRALDAQGVASDELPLIVKFHKPA